MHWALWLCDHQSDALGFVVVWSPIKLRPSLYLLVDSIYPQPINEAGFYSEQASIRGNTVHILMSVYEYVLLAGVHIALANVPYIYMQDCLMSLWLLTKTGTTHSG